MVQSSKNNSVPKVNIVVSAPNNSIAVNITVTQPGEKGKRGAVNRIEKASAKKQKAERHETVISKQTVEKAPASAKKAANLSKKPNEDSSSDSSDSDSDDEVKNGVSKKEAKKSNKDSSSDSSDSDSDDEVKDDVSTKEAKNSNKDRNSNSSDDEKPEEVKNGYPKKPRHQETMTHLVTGRLLMMMTAALTKKKMLRFRLLHKLRSSLVRQKSLLLMMTAALKCFESRLN